MKCSYLLPLSIVIGLFATPASADPPRTSSVTCTGGGLAARPKFTQVSPGRAEYNFSGVCTTREGRFLGYRVDGTWTPTESAGDNADASETYHVATLSGPSQSYVAVVGWHCGTDPWLHDVTCARVGDNIPDELRALWEEVGQGSWPPSTRGIPRDQREALIAEYERANGRFDRSGILTDSVRADAAGSYGSVQMQQGGSAYHPADAVSLNPQPLPPDPHPDPMPQQAATSMTVSQGTGAAIIIVGGKTSDRPVNATQRTVESSPQPTTQP